MGRGPINFADCFAGRRAGVMRTLTGGAKHAPPPFLFRTDFCAAGSSRIQSTSASTGLLLLLDRSRQHAPITITFDSQGNRLADALQADMIPHLGGAMDLDPIDGDHDVTALQTRALGRRTRSTWATTAPSVAPTRIAFAISGVRSCTAMPILPRRTSPYSMIWSMTARAMLIGTANPMPTLPPLGARIAVLIPISRPRRSTSAPPELPGLIEASVWMKSS